MPCSAVQGKVLVNKIEHFADIHFNFPVVRGFEPCHVSFPCVTNKEICLV